MKNVLCILTTTDEMASAAVTAQKKIPNCAVQTFDLTVPAPNYEKLLDAIESADSVQVW